MIIKPVMLNLEELFKTRRDTRHFKSDEVPESVLEKALEAGHTAPSVGLTDASRYYIIRDRAIKVEVKKLFDTSNSEALDCIPEQGRKNLYNSLKLEAILDAPVGLVVCYDRSVLNDFTIGTIATNETIKFSAVCAVENIWLSLTSQGYSMGWISILNYYHFKKLLGLPDEIEPLGYFCIGKPDTDYQQQPMLQQLGWKNKSLKPNVTIVSSIPGKSISNNEESGKKSRIEVSLQPDSFNKPINVVPENFSDNYLLNDEVSRSFLNTHATELSKKIKEKISKKTKPEGSLGVLEDLAFQIGMVLKSLNPELIKPHLIVFAADHGISAHNMSKYPMEVTRQMVNTYLKGGAAINVFCRQNAIELLLIDAGVNYDFSPSQKILNQKVGKGTASFLSGPAMTSQELQLCFEMGRTLIKQLSVKGCNIIGFGEMGIGNTSSASALMSVLCKIPIAECVGKGTGLDESQLSHKIQVLEQAMKNFNGDSEALTYMAWFGGFEILQIAGSILEARQQNMVILIDGFIATTAFLCAYMLDKTLIENAIFCHESGEKGHRRLLSFLGAEPLLKLSLRLGEGTGCALAYPLIKSAVNFLNEMSTFESASVSGSI